MIDKTTLDVTIKALLNASGINTNQAKTAAYYAVLTYLNLDIMPILIIMGKAGTGKSSLMKQLEKVVKQPKWVNVKTSAALRTELSWVDVTTVLIEEGDKIDENLITCRYSKETAEIAVRIQKERSWENTNLNIFGATIIHRRLPLSDVPLGSRCIIIQTEYKPGSYTIQEIGSEEVKAVAKLVYEIPKTSHRVENNWAPLIAVATVLGDEEWLAYAREQIEKDKKSLVAAQSYEPLDALVLTLRALMVPSGTIAISVLVSKIKEHLAHDYDINLKSYQIDEMCTGLGFEVSNRSGYPTVKPNLELLRDLIVKHSR